MLPQCFKSKIPKLTNADVFKKIVEFYPKMLVVFDPRSL